MNKAKIINVDGFPPLQENQDECWNCGAHGNLETHHAFFGTADRKNSELLGLTVKLCAYCHRNQPDGIHGGNTELDQRLKKAAQRHFEEYFSHELFMEIFMKDYLN